VGGGLPAAIASMHDDANLGLDLGLLKGIGGVRLPEERVLDVPPRLDALDDSDGALEELGQRAMSQEYDPQAFASLRRLQILDHHRNGSISDRASLSVCNVTWNVAGLAPTPASVLEALGPSPAVLPDLVIFGVQVRTYPPTPSLPPYTHAHTRTYV